MADNERIIFPERGVVRVEACPVPEPGAGAVLIRTRATLVSTGTELTALMADCPPGSTWEAMFRFPVPDEVSDEQAAFATIAEIVMNGVRRSGLTWGESAVVFGAGS